MGFKAKFSTGKGKDRFEGNHEEYEKWKKDRANQGEGKESKSSTDLHELRKRRDALINETEFMKDPPSGHDPAAIRKEVDEHRRGTFKGKLSDTASQIRKLDQEINKLKKAEGDTSYEPDRWAKVDKSWEKKKKSSAPKKETSKPSNETDWLKKGMLRGSKSSSSKNEMTDLQKTIIESQSQGLSAQPELKKKQSPTLMSKILNLS